MKSILLAALAVVATVAPLQAKKVKPQAFTVQNVTIVSVNGKMPNSAVVFKKGSTVMLTITANKLKGPKKIALPIVGTSVSSDIYRKATGTLQYTVANVHKNTTTHKPVGVDLTFFGPVKIFGNVTAAGQVSYTLVPKE